MNNQISKKLIISFFSVVFMFFGSIDTTDAQFRRSGFSKYKQLKYGINSRSSFGIRNNRSFRRSGFRSRSSIGGFGFGSRFGSSFSTVIRFGSHNYGFHNGLYYRSYNNRFRVVSAPIGIVVNSIPSSRHRFIHGGIDYFYSHGTYYRSIGNRYQVVRPPIGARFS